MSCLGGSGPIPCGVKGDGEEILLYSGVLMGGGLLILVGVGEGEPGGRSQGPWQPRGTGHIKHIMVSLQVLGNKYFLACEGGFGGDGLLRWSILLE